MRYLPHTEADRQNMLEAIEVGSVDELFRDVPKDALQNIDGVLPRHMSELEVEKYFADISERNISAGSLPFFLGAGAYRHHIPASVDHLIQRSEYLTAYTPYQPEISQGTLQMLFEFQTQVSLITGMEVANASMYDGATACAEAVLMSTRINGRHNAVFSGNIHPHYLDTTRTFLRHMPVCIKSLPPNLEVEEFSSSIDQDTACIVVQNPDVFGKIQDLTPIAELAHENGALLIAVFTEVLSLGAISAPGDMGADIVVGEGQSVGNALNFGGPYLGLFATRKAYIRQMPGRVCGETVDCDGRRGYVLTLSTREQHIRREKATSNICTNSGLCALAFCVHLSLLGERGLGKLSMLNHKLAVQLAERLANINGVEIVNDACFNEFTLRLPKGASKVISTMLERGVLGGVPAARLFPKRENMENLLIVAVTETNSEEDISKFEETLRGCCYE